MDSRILIVDDDAASCAFMKDVLIQATGTEVLALTESRAASTCLTKEKFMVILLDFQMPSPDGPELARLARKSGMNQMTPIIMVSDDQSTSAISQGFAAGAHFFLYKPVDKARLLRLVRAMHGAVEHEKRRFRRVPLQTRVRLQFDHEEFDGETIDVSLNGMLVHTLKTIPTASAVRVSLYATNQGMPITGSGAVVRALSGNRFGIQLNRLAPIESSRLQEFLLPMILKEDNPAIAPVVARA
ncbi:MAG TPA: response regulator [Candidatus Acidoferrales bacterium]